MNSTFALKDDARKFFRCDRGVAFIEFALSIPFLLVLFFGAIEVARYFLVIQKVEKTVDLVTDTITQADQSSSTEKITAASMTSLLSTIPAMMSPYEFNPALLPSRGIVYITDVKRPTDPSKPAEIRWQACGGGTLAHPSSLGSASGDVTSPALASLGSFTMLPGEEVVIGEIYYNFSPILLQNILGDVAMSRTVYFVPRFGTLSDPTTDAAIHCP